MLILKNYNYLKIENCSKLCLRTQFEGITKSALRNRLISYQHSWKLSHCHCTVLAFISVHSLLTDLATSHFDMAMIIRATIWPLFNTDLRLGNQFQFHLSLTAAGKCPEQQSNTSPVKTFSVLLTSNLSQVPDTLWRLLDKGEIIPIYKIWSVVCGPCHSAPSSFVYLFSSLSALPLFLLSR